MLLMKEKEFRSVVEPLPPGYFPKIPALSPTKPCFLPKSPGGAYPESSRPSFLALKICLILGCYLLLQPDLTITCHHYVVDGYQDFPSFSRVLSFQADVFAFAA